LSRSLESFWSKLSPNLHLMSVKNTSALVIKNLQIHKLKDLLKTSLSKDKDAYDQFFIYNYYIYI
jgi:hypothetical protein